MIGSKSRSKSKSKIVALGFLVLACVLFAWAAGYVARSPLRPGESLVALIDFNPALIARGRYVEQTWETFRSLPRYQEFAASPEGKAFLASAPPARAVRRLNQRGRILGRSALDVLDLLGRETIVAVPSMGRGRSAFLLASRIGPRANLLTGLYAAVMRTRPLRTRAGDWWVVVDGGTGVGWTKVGDVLAVSNDLDLLARFAAAAQGGRREPPPLASVLSDDDALQVAVRTLGPARRGAPKGHPRAFVVSLQLGPRPAGTAADASAAFENAASNHVPSDVFAGLAWRLEPASAWRLALDARSETEREHMVRYAEDKVCALLDAEDFEKDVLGRFTGDCVVAVSRRSDPWLSLAAGGPMPTVSFTAGLRSDPHFERQLHVALVDTIGMLTQGRDEFETNILNAEHRGRKITLVQVRPRGSKTGPSAGYFIAPDAHRPGQSILVASTSVAWLRLAIDVHDDRAAPLSRQAGFQDIAPSALSDRPVMGFVDGDALLGVLDRARGSAKDRAHGRAGSEQWLRLLDGLTLEGSLGGDGVVRAVVRISGNRTARAKR